MPEQRFQWMRTDSCDAKASRWNTVANGAAPRETWYYGPRIGRTEMTDALRADIRRAFGPSVDAKFDETLVINGAPLLRVTLPGKFVPHFDADDTTFYLYKAVSALTVVDFGRQWGGPLAEPAFRASPMTKMVAGDEVPSPRAVLRKDLDRAEFASQGPVTTEVEPVPDQPAPRIVERYRPARKPILSVEDLPDVPVSNQTLIPPPERLGTPVAPSADVWKAFGEEGGDEGEEPVVAPSLSSVPVEPPKQAVRSEGSEWMGGVLALLLACLVISVFWVFHLLPWSR